MADELESYTGGQPVWAARVPVVRREPVSLWRMIIDHNPCFILSALSMMFGCYLLNDATGDEAGNMGKTLLVLAALNVYEFSVIGLAVVLMKRKPELRDSRILLGLEALFIVDIGFLNANVALTHLFWGAVINGVLLGLTWVKLGLVLRTLRGGAARAGRGQAGFMGLQLMLLYLLPVLFRWLGSDGTVSAVSVYGMWWAVGMLPVVYDLLQRFWPEEMELGGGNRWVKRLYLALPWMSLVAHLGFFHWVYRTPFYMADLAPVFLGLAVLGGRMPAGLLGPRENLLAIRVILPVVAVLVSLQNPEDLAVGLLGHGGMSPFVLVLLAAVVFYVYMFLFQYLLACAAVLILGLLVHMFGPTAKQSGDVVAGSWARVDRFFEALLPKTAVAWGVIAVSVSFVLLGVGAFLSLRRGKPGEAEGV